PPRLDAPMPTSQNSARAFVYRAGVRIAGTVVACDAAAGGDLVFLSHAASLLCERGGKRSVYAGPLGPAAEVRAADALCLDARYAERDVAFPERVVAEENLRRIAADASTGGAPLLYVEPLALAPLVARALAGAGLPLRAHRRILDALAAYRRVEPAAPVPAVQRFAGRLAEREVLLWPADARAPAPGQTRGRRRVFVSPRAASATVRARPDGLGKMEALVFPFG